MLAIAERKEDATESPDVHLLVHLVAEIQIAHLRRAVHERRVLCDALLLLLHILLYNEALLLPITDL